VSVFLCIGVVAREGPSWFNILAGDLIEEKRIIEKTNLVYIPVHRFIRPQNQSGCSEFAPTSPGLVLWLDDR